MNKGNEIILKVLRKSKYYIHKNIDLNNILSELRTSVFNFYDCLHKM